jgi:hypothetical protein
LTKPHRTLTVMSLLSLAIIGAVTGVSSAAPSSTVKWESAIEVRGLPRHNYLFGSDLFSVSCASPGNCSAGGNYALNAKRSQAFVVDETNGVWGAAQTVPGFTNRDASVNTEVYVMSCPSAGNCSAGGTFAVGSQNTVVFVMSEKDGTWGRAIEVPGSSRFNSGAGFITSLSCTSAGNCSAGGILPVANSTTISGAFVVNETHGVWGHAIELSGPPSFNHNGAGVDALSCASAGNCSAGGNFPKSENGKNTPSFVANETNGVWGKAQALPGSATLNLGESELRSLSCGAPGNCSAVGQYQQRSGVPRAYLVSESSGVWGRAVNVPGLVALNHGHLSSLTTISCAAKGDCVAGGSYGNASHQYAILVSEKNGVWGTPKLIPGLGTLNKGHTSEVQTISCVSNGNCGVAGGYSDSKGNAQSFLLNETSGKWGLAITVPGLKKLKSNSPTVLSISCGSPTSCGAVGNFSAPNNNGALIVNTKVPN